MFVKWIYGKFFNLEIYVKIFKYLVCFKGNWINNLFNIIIFFRGNVYFKIIMGI